jgi:predicted phage terminase large subunit-like protein
MLLCPPQHGKSTVASKRFPAYLLGLNPYTEVISASATAQLAEEFGREVRNCINSQEYRLLFGATQLAEDSQAKGRWSTNDGGGYYAVGMGGALMGRGGELGIIDDPFATWEDAQSQLTRDKAWDWYSGTFYNRIRPGGPIIVIQHRMHEDDLVGRLIEQQNHGGDRWEIIELPALLDDPPWIERYDRPALERIKAISGPRKWSALYLQNPTPDEGTFFKREWFRFYREPPPLNHFMSSDLAVTPDGGDFTSIATHGVDADDDLYLAVDYWSGQTSSDVWVDRICDQIIAHKPYALFGESGVIRRSVEPFLKKRMRERKAYCRVDDCWLPSIHDKASRALALQARAAMGKVLLPDNDHGHKILSQLLAFPAGKFDDDVDMCGLMARAIDQSHRATKVTATAPKQRDYERNEDEDSWKVA